MKKYRSRKKKAFFSSIVAFNLIFAPSILVSQELNGNDDVLLEQALEARSAGNIEQALAYLRELQERRPNDSAVASMIATLEEQLAGNGEIEEESFAAEVSAIELALGEEETRQADLISSARQAQSLAQQDIDAGNYRAAIRRLEGAIDSLPSNVRTDPLRVEMQRQITDTVLRRAQAQLAEGDHQGASQSLAEFREMQERTSRMERAAERLARELEDPRRVPIEAVASDFVQDQARVREFNIRGRAQFRAGAFEDAERSFNQALAIDPDNSEAIHFKQRIAQILDRRKIFARETTRSEMLKEVSEKWRRPTVFIEIDEPEVEEEEEDPLQIKLDQIIIPVVNFRSRDGRDVTFEDAISHLIEASREFDRTGIEPRGLNMVLVGMGDRRDRPVPLVLQNMSVGRILDYLVEEVEADYTFVDGVIEIRPVEEEGARNLETEIYEVSQNAVIRMTGGRGDTGPARPADPFAAPAPAAADDGGDGPAIREFLQASGVDFSNTAGSRLSFTGNDLIITQTPRNHERIRQILARFADIRMVEIEARFLEVQEGALEELGVEWGVDRRRPGQSFQTQNRALRDTAQQADVRTTPVFGPEFDADGVLIGFGQSTVEFPPPSVPAAIDLAQEAGSLATILGRWGEYDVNATIRALSRKSGSDLLSAPKVTVMSGQRAEITVAQEFIYPQSYSDPQVDAGGSGDGGGGGVAITPGTPLDFTMRPVGVELDVTPTVSSDDFHIEMTLLPRVTEFEGFVEYGGSSVAFPVGAPAPVVVPSGFFQPIFNTREVRTEVTVWDGATVVLGGLTREESRTISDKVPVLGDVPLLGRLFRSEGQSVEKRNLLIFVTANLMTPGGSPKNQELRNVRAGSTFQDHFMSTPGGSARRMHSVD